MYADELAVKLQAIGFDSLTAWAKARNLHAGSVCSAVYRWRLRQKGRPGGETLDILMQLSTELREPVSPAIANLAYKESLSCHK